jgi:hypothetical protein
MTAAPSHVNWLGTSPKISQPNKDAQTKSRKRSDCVAEISAIANARVKQ